MVTSRKSAIDRYLLAAGILMISVGVLLNEWLLTAILSPDGILAEVTRLKVWGFDLTMVVIGSALIIHGSNLRVSRWHSLGLLVLVTVALLASYYVRIGYTFQIDYNEGWNLYHGARSVTGSDLYDLSRKWTPVNYPPLSFYIVGSLGRVLGDPLQVGRSISFMALLFVSFGVGYIVKKLKGELFDAALASVICLVMFAAYARGYVGMNDPQLLGHVFMTIALALYIDNRDRVLWVAFISAIGLFTKHNLFLVPLVISIDLFLRSRKDFIKWIAFLTIFIGGLIVLTTLISGNDFIIQMLSSNIRAYDAQRALQWSSRLGPGFLVYLIVALPWLLHAIKKDVARIIPFYLALSLGMGFYMSGGDGTDINMFFDFFIAISIVLGLATSYFRVKIDAFLPRKVDLVSFILPLALSIYLFLNRMPYLISGALLEQYRVHEQSFLDDVHFLSLKAGPVLCTNMSLCYFSEKPLEHDPFLVNQAILGGQIEERELLHRVETGYFSVIQLAYPLDERYSEGLSYTSVRKGTVVFTENFMRALGRHYMLTRETIAGAFYEPNDATRR